jgi:outer membrane protein/adhesin transport system outer membrane protein
MRQALLLGAAFCLLPLAGASADTLDDAFSKAYLSNPTLQAERAQLRATDEGLPQAIAQRRPTVTGSADGGLEQLDASKVGSQTLWQYGGSLGISQPLWTGGRADAAISQADYLVNAERANLANVEEQVLLAAATAYLDVVRDQANLGLAQSNVKVLSTALDQAKAQLNAGLATKTDVSQAEARLAQGVANETAAEANLTNSRAAYQAVVGEMPGTLERPPAVQNLPATQDDSIRLADLHNPQILSAEANKDAARAGVDVARAQLMPSVALTGQLFSANDQQLEGDWQHGAQVLLTLTIPLYQAGGEYSKIRQAKQTYGQRQNQIDATVRSVEQSTTDSWQNMEAAQANIESFTSQIKANEIAFKGTEEEQKVGTRTFLDVLNAQQELFQSQVELVAAQHDQAVSAFQVKSAIGDLTADALALNVDRYDPSVHYNAVREKWWGTDAGVTQ